MGFIKGFFPKSSDKSKRSAGALVFRSIASPFTHSSSRGSQESGSSPSETDYQSLQADKSPPSATHILPPPAQEPQYPSNQKPPVSSTIEAAQLFEGGQNFHSHVDNSNTIDGRTAQAWVGNQTFMDTVTNTNIANQNSGNFNTGNVNSYITGDATTYYGDSRSFAAPTSAPAAFAPSSSSIPVSPTQVYDGSQTFRADMVNRNVGNGPAQSFNGKQEFFGVVSNTNIGTSDAASGGADSSSEENTKNWQTEALAEQMSSCSVEDPALIPESHRLTAPGSVPMSTSPAVAQTPVTPATAPSPAKAAPPLPPPAAAKQVFEGSQKFHSAMYNTNNGSGAGQVFKGDQDFYGPMVNTNVTNSNSGNMNSNNVNSVIGGNTTTHWGGHWTPAGMGYAPQQQGRAPLAIETAKLSILDAQIQDIIQRGVRGPADAARLNALQGMVSGIRASC